MVLNWNFLGGGGCKTNTTFSLFIHQFSGYGEEIAQSKIKNYCCFCCAFDYSRLISVYQNDVKVTKE